MSRDVDPRALDPRIDTGNDRAAFRTNQGDFRPDRADPGMQSTLEATRRFLDYLNCLNPPPSLQSQGQFQGNRPDVSGPAPRYGQPDQQFSNPVPRANTPYVGGNNPEFYPPQRGPVPGPEQVPPELRQRAPGSGNYADLNPQGRGRVPFPNQDYPGHYSTAPGRAPGRSQPENFPPVPVPRPGDRYLPHAIRTPNGLPGQAFELTHMTNRASDHGNKPDAVVYIPPNFDPSQPIRLAVYNHGYYDSAQSAFKNTQIAQQMDNAPPNTVLIVPEWQVSPGAKNYVSGNFGRNGLFKNMVQEVFDKTPGLQGKTLNDVEAIDIIAHSAGHVPAEVELYKNGLESKVHSVTLLDALYNYDGFSHWIRDNIQDLAYGKKRFYNIFNDTSGRSNAQAQGVKQMLAHAGLPTNQFLYDGRKHLNPLDANAIASHSIIFWRSDATTSGLRVHGSMPNLYIGSVENAQNYV